MSREEERHSNTEPNASFGEASPQQTPELLNIQRNRILEVFGALQSADPGFYRRATAAAVGSFATKLAVPDYFTASVPKSLHEETGNAYLDLLTDWTWIHRRVETIQALEDGHTRRQISIDFSLPYKPAFHWRAALARAEMEDSGAPKTQEVVAPISFMRKGMLINLNTRDSSDNKLPSLSTSENGTLTYLAMKQLVDHLQLAQRLADDPDLRCIPLTSLAREQENAVEAWQRILHYAVYAIIMNKGLDNSIYEPDDKRRPHSEDNATTIRKNQLQQIQNTHRHDLFNSLAHAAALRQCQVPTSGSSHLDNHIMIPLWLLHPDEIEEKQRAQAKALDKESQTADLMLGVFDTDFSIQVLAYGLLRQILDTHTVMPTSCHLEVLCQLLSITSISYLYALVVPTAYVWQELPERESTIPRIVPRRALLKINCEVEAIDSETPGPTTVVVQQSNLSANGTHLEFVPPGDTQITKIEALVPAGTPRGSTIESEASFSESEKNEQNQLRCRSYIAIADGNAVEWGRNSTLRIPWSNDPLGAFLRAPSKPEPTGSHGAYRTTPFAVHLSKGIHGPFSSPLEYLQFTITPRDPWQLWVSLISTLSFISFSLLLCTYQSGEGSTSRPRFFGKVEIADMVAVITLIIAVFGAMFWTASRSTMSKKAWHPVRWSVATAGFISFISFAFPYFTASFFTDTNSPSASHSFYVTNVIVFCLCTVAVVCSTLYFAHTAGIFEFSESHWIVTKAGSNRERRITERVGAFKIFDRTKNVLAATETGAWDCEYLNEHFISDYQPQRASSIYDHISDLHKSVSEIIIPIGNEGIHQNA